MRLLLWGVALCSLSAQETNVVTVRSALTKVKPGEKTEARLTIALREGYHVSSNTPSDKYYIPLTLTWNSKLIETPEVTFPKAQMEKYSFTPTPISVFSGNFDLVTKFTVSASAPGGQVVVPGKLRYQACNDKMCLMPKTVDVTLALDVQR